MTPKVARRIHLTLMLLWIMPGLPVSWYLRQSVPWLVFLSVYAIIVGHWSALSAERPHEIHKEDNES
jgi:hypothetical protein